MKKKITIQNPDYQNIPDPDQIKEREEEIRLLSYKLAPITIIPAAKPIIDLPDMEAESRQKNPLPPETKDPAGHEKSKGEIIEASKIQKKKPPAIATSFPGSRPVRPDKLQKDAGYIVAEKLAPQLGADPEILASGRWDERKNSVLTSREVMALAHFSYRYVYDKVRYHGHLVDWILVGNQGVGGLGRRHYLQAIASASGSHQIDKAIKPNVLSRNLWDRDWKNKATAEGKVVEEE